MSDIEWAFLIPILYSAVVAGTNAYQRGGDFGDGAWKGALSGGVAVAGGLALFHILIIPKN